MKNNIHHKHVPSTSVSPALTSGGIVISLRLYVILFLIILLLGIASAVWLAQSEDTRMRTELTIQAQIITAGIDLKKLNSLKGLPSDGKLTDYRDLKTQLIAFRAANPLCRFIYVTGIKNDGNIFFFVDSEPIESGEYSPPGQFYEEASDHFKRVFSTGEPYVEGPVADRWGNWVSALLPIIDPKSQNIYAVLGIDVDARNWTADILSHCTPAILTSLLFMALLTFLFILFRRSDRARRQIAESNNRLLESERAYRSVVTNMLDVFFRVDTHNEFVMLSPSAARLLGYNHIEDLLGKKADSIWAHPEHRKNLFASLQVFGSLSDYEMTARHRNGSELPLSVTIHTIHDDLGNPAGYEGIARDISDRKEAEKQIQRAQKMEALGSLAGGVAHDLNNILSGIVSYPDLILMQLPDNSELRRPIETIRESGMKAGAIVEDLLTLARRGIPTEESVNLNKLIAEYLSSPEFIKMKSFHHQVSVHSELDDSLMNISGSPVHLSKTIMNLVSNAAESMPDGGMIRITTYNRYLDYKLKAYDHVQEGNYTVLSVSDEGMGISSEDQARMFEPFFTKKKMGRSGTGLGLAVVWGTVKDHQGYIDVQSEEGHGTIFTLYFPITGNADFVKPATMIAHDIRGREEKILVVDDVRQQREISSAILRQLNYDVATVASGEEAVRYLKENRADLIILDMIMDPGIDGVETYERILTHTPGQKAIITSGYAETERVKKTLILGAGSYLKKPYTLENLGQAVKEELRKSSPP